MKKGCKLFLIMIDDDNHGDGDGENLSVNVNDTRVHPNKWARGALVALKLFASYEVASLHWVLMQLGSINQRSTEEEEEKFCKIGVGCIRHRYNKKARSCANNQHQVALILFATFEVASLHWVLMGLGRLQTLQFNPLQSINHRAR